MGDLFGGGGANPFIVPGGLGVDVSGGGLGAGFSFGPSNFDVYRLGDATRSDLSSITNRYNQLGLGGSNAMSTDLTAVGPQSQAVAGAQETKDVTNPALNPALQTPITQLLGATSPGQVSTSGGSSASNTDSTLTNLALQLGLQTAMGGL